MAKKIRFADDEEEVFISSNDKSNNLVIKSYSFLFEILKNTLLHNFWMHISLNKKIKLLVFIILIYLLSIFYINIIVLRNNEDKSGYFHSTLHTLEALALISISSFFFHYSTPTHSSINYNFFYFIFISEVMFSTSFFSKSSFFLHLLTDISIFFFLFFICFYRPKLLSLYGRLDLIFVIITLTKIYSLEQIVLVPLCLRRLIGISLFILMGSSLNAFEKKEKSILEEKTDNIVSNSRLSSPLRSKHRQELGPNSFSRRRISLPTLQVKTNNQMNLDSTLLREAQGLLSQLICDQNLPPHLLKHLKVISDIFKTQHPKQRQDGADDDVCDELYSSFLLRHKRQRRHVETLQPHSQTHVKPPADADEDPVFSRRASTPHRSVSSSWTTTTSATGLPEFESFATRRTSDVISVDRADLRRDSASSNDQDTVFDDNDKSSDNDAKTLPFTDPAFSYQNNMNILNNQTAIDSDERNSNQKVNLDKTSNILKKPKKAEQEDNGKNVSKMTGTALQIDVEQLSSEHELLTSSSLSSWDYPIFRLSSIFPQCMLSKMVYQVFEHSNLTQHFKIPLNAFFSFFHTVELGYHDNPYHNRIHASDVLHAVYYFTSQPLPALNQASPMGEQNESNENTSNTQTIKVTEQQNSASIIGSGCLNPLELMSLYTAAAIHDLDHPGRTNAFLVSIAHPMAILYNDRSVLESHHCASAWKIINEQPSCDWLVNLQAADWKRFRFLVIEVVLATDLKKHFELVADFNSKANDEDSAGIDWSQDADRLMVMNMLIKMADINGPCKKHHLHLQWSRRIVQEFYMQGDDERSRGIPVSPFMDKLNPQVATLQASFINHLVSPLCHALFDANLLPSWEKPEDETVEGTNKEDHASRSPLIENLHNNIAAWSAYNNNNTLPPLLQSLEGSIEDVLDDDAH